MLLEMFLDMKGSTQKWYWVNLLNKEMTLDTPLKIDMEPKNHPFEKENHLPNLRYCVPC